MCGTRDLFSRPESESSGSSRPVIRGLPQAGDTSVSRELKMLIKGRPGGGVSFLFRNLRLRSVNYLPRAETVSGFGIDRRLLDEAAGGSSANPLPYKVPVQSRLPTTPSRRLRRPFLAYGAAQESNLPTVGLRRRTGFEDRPSFALLAAYRAGLRRITVRCAPVFAPVDST